MTPVKVNIAGVPVHAINMTTAVQLLTAWVVQRERCCVYLCNIRSVACCMRDQSLRGTFLNASLVTPDGMPLVNILRWRGFPNAGRVYGPDLMLALCAHLQSFGSSHFLYGGAPGVPDRLAACLSGRFKDIKIAGAWSPPFRALTREENRAAISRINDSGADVVWVGLGGPKQERWIAEHRDALSAPLLIGVGYAFDALSGVKRQAPVWLRESGFEWAFRFALEPARMWPRVFIDGPLFLAALAGQTLGVRRFAAPLHTIQKSESLS